jgi:hypothetical protein
MPACVEKRQTRSFRAINLISLVTSDGKPTQNEARKCPRCQQTTLEYHVERGCPESVDFEEKEEECDN